MKTPRHESRRARSGGGHNERGRAPDGGAAPLAKPRNRTPDPILSAMIRSGSKASKIIKLLTRPEGATLAQLVKATKWQTHSVRGFLSGTVRKKMGLTLTSLKREGSERVYKIEAR